MADSVKITKAMVLEVIKANVENMEFAGDVTAEDVINYVDVTLEQMATKAAKNKERAAAKRQAGDELQAQVLAVLGEDFMTRDDVAAAFEDEDITPAKVGARLTQLVKAGSVVKDKMKIDGKDKTVYALASASVTDGE